jgi:serine/threonine-protein kinase
MAPEQTQAGARVDARSDVYALGGILHLLITDRPPGGPLPARIPGVPRTLGAICLKAMAPDPAARYADAARLGADVERFLDGQSVEARREGLGERIGRFLGRHRAAVALLLAYLAMRLLLLAVRPG